MKGLLITLFVLVSSSAFANELVCHDVNAGPDHGYIVTLDRNLETALIQTQSIMGPRDLAELECVKFRRSSQRGADMSYPIANCQNPRLADSRYVVRVFAGGFTGLTQAQLYTTSLLGAEKIADLICR